MNKVAATKPLRWLLLPAMTVGDAHDNHVAATKPLRWLLLPLQYNPLSCLRFWGYLREPLLHPSSRPINPHPLSSNCLASALRAKPVLEKALGSLPLGPAFTPTRQALYAIEHAAYGTATSPAAVAYQDEHLARQGWTKAAAVVLGVLAVAVGGVAVGFLALHRILAQRVRRIQSLLTPGAATANNN